MQPLCGRGACQSSCSTALAGGQLSQSHGPWLNQFCSLVPLSNLADLLVPLECLTLRVVRAAWPRLAREGVGAPSMEALEVRLSGAQSHLLCLQLLLLSAGGLGWLTWRGPFPPGALPESLQWNSVPRP